mgnify:CR=1 FL=1
MAQGKLKVKTNVPSTVKGKNKNKNKNTPVIQRRNSKYFFYKIVL